MNWAAMTLTLKLAFVVCVTLLVIGLPLSYWLAYTRVRWKFLVESVVALPLVLPPTVLGFYVLIAMGPHSPFGRLYQSWMGHGLPFTFEGLVVGSVLYSLPFTVQPITSAFSSVDSTLLNASAILGASKLRTFRRIIMPLSIGGIVTGLVLTFAHTLGEFGVVLMVGGNIPGVSQTISITIYDNVQALDYATANHTSLVLLAVSFATLSILYALNRRAGAGWLVQQ
ncbi:MAG TPA: molybdate ABC transporter permease subunit [Candidatus Binataceae bacterium]|nr:molybdate ABC transporter permease subunit [Candidatus Binataceae bacterium]